MNATDGTDDSRGNNLYRWFAHPLTTLLVILTWTLIFALVFGIEFALTVFGGAVSMITTCSRAYRPNDSAA
ncbi:hypothetical protein [Rhodococcus aetherivorans]|uniref:hypothetical protein n=1 Tax=Rhodococcus aetherivorans TaxID=191292 RepID=UPI002948CC7D|nr:hypothetical protein [Rhodococcus aetherivorans]MDV6296706.1 hypothetical protein [Rhodococcus aetherivorans]